MDDEGICKIKIDPLFLETVNTDYEYQVFLQAYGDGKLWVDSRKPDFYSQRHIRHGVGWKLKAKQRGHKTERLKIIEEVNHAEHTENNT